MIFSLNMLQKRTQLHFWMKMALSSEVGPGAHGPQGPKNTDIFHKKGVLLFSSFYGRKN